MPFPARMVHDLSTCLFDCLVQLLCTRENKFFEMAPGNQEGTGCGVNDPDHIGPCFDERLRVVDERLKKRVHQIFYELWVLINVSHESGQAPEHVSFSPRGINPCVDKYIGPYGCPQFS